MKKIIGSILGIIAVLILGYFFNFKSLLFQISSIMMLVEGIIRPIIGILLVLVLIKVLIILDLYIKKHKDKQEPEVLDRERLLVVLKKLKIESLDLEEGPTSMVLKNKLGKTYSITIEKSGSDQVSVQVGRFMFKKKYYYTYEELI